MLFAAVQCMALSRAHGIQMAVSPKIQSLTFETATVKELPEVSSFFVDAFWLASTTFGSIELSASDKRQLATKVSEDLGPRYGMITDKRPPMMGGKAGFPSKCLFETRLILARDTSGTIVGCAGIEAALYESGQGQLFRSDQADQLVRTELNAMTNAEAAKASEAYKAGGIGGLAKGVIGQEFTDQLIAKYITIWKPCSVLANLAVAPSYRRTGLGRALCDECERCTTEDWKLDEIALQVEEDNTPAITLYRKDGYSDVFRAEEATALRLQPSEKESLFSALPGPFSALGPANEKLLKEIASPTVTMSKMLV